MHTNDLNRTISFLMFLGVLVIVNTLTTGCQTPVPTAIPSPTHDPFAFFDSEQAEVDQLRVILTCLVYNDEVQALAKEDSERIPKWLRDRMNKNPSYPPLEIMVMGNPTIRALVWDRYDVVIALRDAAQEFGCR